jgi:hypothetical protein
MLGVNELIQLLVDISANFTLAEYCIKVNKSGAQSLSSGRSSCRIPGCKVAKLEPKQPILCPGT